MKEGLRYKTRWKITRYACEEDAKRKIRYTADQAHQFFNGKEQESIIEGNLMLNEGINELWTLVCGTGGTKFDSANAFIGVGDSTATAAATQTGLQAPTNKLYKAMEVGYPTYGTSQQAIWQAAFTGTEANWAWNEFCVANGNSDSAKNLNRKVSAEGTKVLGQQWDCQIVITLS